MVIRQKGVGESVKYGVAISEEHLGENAPVLFQGGLEKSIVRASLMGFNSVEIHIRNPNTFDADRLLGIANKNKIHICAVGTGLEYSLNGLCLTSPDMDRRGRTSSRLKEHIDLAAKLNAVVFLGLCRGVAPSHSAHMEYLDRLATELVPIALYALKKGVILAFEPIVFYMTNLLNTTEETLRFLERPGLGTIQLLLDTHHMFIEDKNMEEAFRACKGKIAHVHFSDSNRKYPGSGNVDYTMVCNTLVDIGYDRVVSLEVLPYPSAEQAAREGLKLMKSKLYETL